MRFFGQSAFMNRQRLFFYIPTALLSVMMLFNAGMYFFNTALVQAEFIKLGFPTWIILPLGVAKVLGVLTLWIRPNRAVVEWAYAGFFFDFCLAAYAHIHVADGDFPAALAALSCWVPRVFGWIGRLPSPLCIGAFLGA